MSIFQFQCIELKLEPSTEQYGRFVGKPLEIGYGITIGTILRRVLLTSLSGLRIVGLRLAEVNHEFATIPGVREDVLEILLNLKEIIFKSSEGETSFDYRPTARLKIKGPAVITAGALTVPSNIEVVNPAHYIATLSENAVFDLEVYLDWGTGYTLAENQVIKNNIDSFDYIKIDSNFMPVSRVNCLVESMNVEPMSNDRSTDKEKLILDIWTNGSITPDQALAQATEIILNLFEIILDSQIVMKEKTETFSKFEEPVFYEKTEIPIEQLNLSVRSYNALKKAKINFVDELSEYSINELKGLKNFGQKSLLEVMDILERQFEIVLK